MAGTDYLWQGGRKIAIRKHDDAITIHAQDEADAQGAAARAGVQLRELKPATRGIVRANVVGDREAAVERLRAQQKVVHHVYRDARDTGSEYLVTESFFLKFKDGTPVERIREYLQREHLEVERDMGDRTFLVRVTDATSRGPVRMANEAADRSDVEYAEPNLVRPLQRFAFIPPDELFAEQWHLHAPSAGPDLVAGAGIFAPEAWDITRGRRDVVIAVADDGFDLTHPDFQGEGKVVARLNAKLRPNDDAAIDWDDAVQPRAGDYHGTPCLGVAVAEGNGTGVVGVAPGCALVAVRFPLQQMTDAHFVTMFEKISTLADVVSCSWGVGPADFPMSTALKSAMSRLATSGGRRGKGLVFCIAAGNNNCPVQDLENTRTYRFRNQFGGLNSYSGTIDRWMAAHPDAITVSACTSLKTRSAYSSWGRQISVCAPSDNWDDLGQITPPGRGIVTTDNEGAGPGSDFTQGSRFTNRFGGTSSATPTVAGVCGLVLSADPGLSAKAVRDILRQTADKDLSLETHTPVNEPGNFNAEGFSLWFGYGKVNAFRAVRAAAESGPRTQNRVDVSVEPALTIPDAPGEPVLARLEITQPGRIADLRVQVDISHSYIGDLRVDLLAPDGTGVPLHANTDDSADNLRRTFTVANKPALRALLGKPIRGTWQLRVVDDFRLDEGRLNRWRIAARVEAG
jgi:subtilisin family serine protease